MTKMNIKSKRESHIKTNTIALIKLYLVKH